MKTILQTLFVALFAASATAQGPLDALIPIPNKVEVCSKGRTYSIDKKSAIKTTLARDSHCIKELQKSIERHTGAAVPVSEKGDIIVETDTTLQGCEHYTIAITPKGIHIKGSTETA